MLNPSGYSIITSPGERTQEHDTFTCAHCRQITFTQAGFNGPLKVVVIKADASMVTQDVGKCFRCDAYVCPRCQGGPCRPGMARIEAEEAIARKIAAG